MDDLPLEVGPSLMESEPISARSRRLTMRRAITPILGVLLILLAAGSTSAAPTGRAAPPSRLFDLTQSHTPVQNPSLFPDGGWNPGDDRDNGDDDAPGETVKPNVVPTPPPSNGESQAWIALGSYWTWIFLL